MNALVRNARLASRFVASIALSAVLAGTVLAGWLPARALGRLPAWRSVVTRAWARSLGYVIGMRVRRRGHAPTRPTVLVTNHLSYVDILLLGGEVPCVFVSKAEVGGWPGIGLLARLSGTLFVDRGRRRDVVRVGTEIERALQDGRVVVIFPEGTSTAGEEVAPFRSSLLEPAAALGIPVDWATLRYAAPEGETPARWSVAWWGDMGLAPHLVELLRMPGFEAEIVFGERPIVAEDRKELGRALHAAVASAFVPLDGADTDAPRWMTGSEARVAGS